MLSDIYGVLILVCLIVVSAGLGYLLGRDGNS